MWWLAGWLGGWTGEEKREDSGMEKEKSKRKKGGRVDEVQGREEEGPGWEHMEQRKGSEKKVLDWNIPLLDSIQEPVRSNLARRVVVKPRPHKVALREIARVDRDVRVGTARRRRQEVVLGRVGGEVRPQRGAERVKVCGAPVLLVCRATDRLVVLDMGGGPRRKRTQVEPVQHG